MTVAQSESDKEFIEAVHFFLVVLCCFLVIFSFISSFIQISLACSIWIEMRIAQVQSLARADGASTAHTIWRAICGACLLFAASDLDLRCIWPANLASQPAMSRKRTRARVESFSHGSLKRRTNCNGSQQSLEDSAGRCARRASLQPKLGFAAHSAKWADQAPALTTSITNTKLPVA